MAECKATLSAVEAARKTMSDQPDIDYEAERTLFKEWASSMKSPILMYEPWLARARLAAKREWELCDMLADAQHAVCCYSCPEPREGEPERHCDLCRRITAALAKREDGVPQTVLTANAKPLFEFDERSFVDLEELKRRGFVCRIATVAVSNPETGEEKILMLPLGEE